MSISRRMDEKAVEHIHNGILLSHAKNTLDSVLMRRMKLEPIIQSEVSQKEKPFFLYISKMEEKGNWCPKGLEIGP